MKIALISRHKRVLLHSEQVFEYIVFHHKYKPLFRMTNKTPFGDGFLIGQSFLLPNNQIPDLSANSEFPGIFSRFPHLHSAVSSQP